MKLDPQNALLTVIAAVLVSISVKLWFFAPPTFGDFLAIKDLPEENRSAARVALFHRVPLVRVRGGEVEVSGSVEVTGTVSID